MIRAQETPDEVRRLAALRDYGVLDTLPEQALDDLTSLAAAICGTPIAMISLIDAHRQWFKSKVGTDMVETARDISFCGHAVQHRDLFIVPDATHDARFADNPLVTGDPHIRFYAGAPLVNSDDAAVGSLCVIDHVPRVLTPEQEQALRILGRQVVQHLELHRRTRELAKSENMFRMLAENIGDVFWIAAPDFQKIYYVSPNYETVWGRSAESLYAHPHEWLEAVVAEERAHVREIFAPLMESEASVSIEYRIKRPDDTLRWVHDRGFQVRDTAGRLIQLTGIVTDITERKQAEEVLSGSSSRAANQQKKQVYKDLGIISVLSIFVFVAGYYSGVFDWAFHYVDSHDTGFGGFWDETVGTLLFVSLSLMVFSYRRWRESRAETLSQTQISNSLTVLHQEMEARVRERTAELVKTNRALQTEMVERLRAEAVIKQFPAIIESSDDAIISKNLDGIITTWNPAAERMFGYTAPEIIGQPITTLFPKDRLQEEIEILARISRGERVRHFETVRVRKDGRPLEVSATISPIKDAEGKIVGVSKIVRDITDRKQAERQIAEQAALLDKARDAILVRDLDGKVRYWNSGAERMYGWTRPEAVGRNVRDLFYADPQKFEAVNAEVIREGEWNGELQHLTKQKDVITIEGRWTLIRDNEGNPKSVLAINTDITERKKIEAQFMRAQRMESIGTLAGGVAHDLNNILAPIMMSIDILKDLSENPQAKMILDTIKVSAKRGADIVRQVLSFARGLEGERIEVQPKDLLKDLENLIKDTFPKDIRLLFKMPDDVWPILGDPTQVHQILLNLFVNARDAMPNGGTLTVEVENCVLDEHYAAMNIQAKAGHFVLISVNDTGTGIPQNILEKVFEPFFTTKEISKGTGLGLSTVLAIVKSHEGIVNVYSEPNKGTTFKVYLPAIEASSAAQRAEVEVASLPRGNGETVLVVDDEASILTITSQTLQAFGYRVLTANNGAAAVAVYAEKKNEIAVVLTDMMMPIMDGPATIHALFQINPAVKIVAASGLHTNGAEAKVAGEGVKHFLTKPYTAETLLKTLRLVLAAA